MVLSQRGKIDISRPWNGDWNYWVVLLVVWFVFYLTVSSSEKKISSWLALLPLLMDVGGGLMEK